MRLFLLLALLILTVAAERNPIKSVADKKRSKVENQLSEKSKGRRYLKKILDLPRQSSVLDKVANKETRKVENELKLRQKTIPKPKILASGICASSPQLPCCKETIEVFNAKNGPGTIADLDFPDCRPDGYYKPKQCGFGGCICVDANGKFIKGGKPGDRSIKCPSEDGCQRKGGSCGSDLDCCQPGLFCIELGTHHMPFNYCDSEFPPGYKPNLSKEKKKKEVLDKVANKETRKVENQLKLRQKTIPKPPILASGICASSPQLPCCKSTIEAFNLRNSPYAIADVSFPKCQPDGYYKPMQCSWHSCYCVDANGKFIKEGKPGESLKCPGEVLDVVADKETRKVENQFEFEKKEIAASVVDV